MGYWPPSGGRLGTPPKTQLVAQDCSIPCKITECFLSPLSPQSKPRLGCIWGPSAFCREAGVRMMLFSKLEETEKFPSLPNFSQAIFCFPLMVRRNPQAWVCAPPIAGPMGNCQHPSKKGELNPPDLAGHGAGTHRARTGNGWKTTPLALLYISPPDSFSTPVAGKSWADPS